MNVSAEFDGCTDSHLKKAVIGPGREVHVENIGWPRQGVSVLLCELGGVVFPFCHWPFLLSTH